MTAGDAPLRPTLVPYRERWTGLVDRGKMWSTDKELPYLERDEEPRGTWVGIGEFSGDVIPRKANCDPLPGLQSGTWDGPTALTIVGEDLLGIVAPEDTSQPAVWFWVTSSAVTEFGAVAESSSGPVITISAEGWVGSPHEPDRAFEGWSLRLRDVARLEQPCWMRALHEPISLEATQESSLLDALRKLELPESGPSPQPPRNTASEPGALGALDDSSEHDVGSPSHSQQWTEKLARKPLTVTGAILQSPLESIRVGPRLTRLGLLGIGCAVTSREPPVSGGIPFSEFGEEADGSWGGLAVFIGEASLLDGDGVLHPARTVTLAGSCALTLAGDRLLGILDADDQGRQLWASQDLGLPEEADQSVWFSAARSSVTLEASGEQGMLGKRPVLLQIGADNWDVHLRHVHRFTRACTRDTAIRQNSAQPRAENSLVAALASS
jgi:hypothetical protein